MKIVFAIKSMDHGIGGAERVLADVTSELVKRGHEVVLLSYDKENGQSFYPLNPNVRRVNLDVGNSETRSGVLETLKRMKAIRSQIKKEAPDVVIGFMHSMFIPLGFSLIGVGMPVIGSEHIVYDHYKTCRLQFLLWLLSYPFLDCITVVSQYAKNSFPSFVRKKLVVITNAVSFEAKELEKENAPQNTIINVARLEKQKDQETLIRAFSFIAHKYPQWTVKIFGQGSQEQNLHNLIRELNLNDRISLCGVTQDISSEYKKSDIMALPSYYESFGLVVVEAMAHGVPVVGFSSCPGVNEIISDGVDGVLVKSGAEDRVVQYASALNDLIASPDLRKSMGAEAREIARKFCVQGITDQWETLFENVRRKC